MKKIIDNSYFFIDEIFRNLSIFVLVILFIKIVFSPALLTGINLSVFIIGVIVFGALRMITK